MHDVIVIGGGSAGVAAALSAREAGAKSVCVIEEKLLGGDCPHEACVPSKVLLASARLYYKMAHEGGMFGVEAKSLSFDFARVVKRKTAVVNLITGNEKRLEKYLEMQKIDVVKGRAYFVDASTIRVGARVLKSKAFVIATGSVDITPPIHGIEETPYLTYADVTKLKKLPSSIAIIGAGPVGTEMATFFAEVGVKTALLQIAPHILPREDEELSVLAEARLRTLGVSVLTKTIALGLKKERKGIRLTYQTGKSPRKTMFVEKVLIASGKRPNVANLHLEAAGIKEENGKIELAPTLRTKAKNIFVAGDASSHLAFTHTAHYEGSIAGFNAANVSKPKSMQSVELGIVPRVTFTDPELASVGLTAQEAALAGHDIRILKTPLGVLGRAAVDGRREGMLKIIVEKKTDLILGAHMFGERSGEVIHEVALAMRTGVTAAVLQSGIRAYPTYSEGISLAQEL